MVCKCQKWEKSEYPLPFSFKLEISISISKVIFFKIQFKLWVDAYFIISSLTTLSYLYVRIGLRN